MFQLIRLCSFAQKKPVQAEKVYYTISKNACWQGHFYAAVNNTVRAKHERATPKDLLCKDFCVYYTISKNACSQGHFYSAVNSTADRNEVGKAERL